MSIIESIKEERIRQDEKWGHPRKNHNVEWLAILGEEFGELCKAVLTWHFGKSDSIASGNMFNESIQVIAVVVAWLEHLGHDFE